MRTQDYLGGTGTYSLFGTGEAFSNDSIISNSSGVSFNTSSLSSAVSNVGGVSTNQTFYPCFLTANTTSAQNCNTFAGFSLNPSTSLMTWTGSILVNGGATVEWSASGRQFNAKANGSLILSDATSGQNALSIAYNSTAAKDQVGIQTTTPSSAFTVNGAISDGTATTTNVDGRGKITLVAGTASYTFHQGNGAAGVWTTAPICQIQDSIFADQANTSTFSVTTSTLTIGNTTNPTDTYTYICKFGN
jgi:hypothetical protein